MAKVAPSAMTMERIGETKQMILAQSTSQCCRHGICQPSINWVIREADNYHGGNPHQLEQQAWIHEESTFFMRCCSGCIPGCREVKYVQHGSTIPESVVKGEDYRWCTCQGDELPKGLSEEDRNKDIVATHEKKQTCGAHLSGCCKPHPYLETKDADGKTIGKTEFVCDWWLCVPKFDIYDGSGEKKYRLRPDTCIGGCCVMCRCGGKGSGGKCCRVPYIVRDPNTFEPIKGNDGKENSQATQLFSGWKNECCTQRNAYHLVFPDTATAEDKATLIGASILIDVLYAEQQNDDDN